MTEWKPKLKKYRHFDRLISEAEINQLVKDPVRVANHPFFPFICYSQRYKRFGKGLRIKRKKARKIRYAARGDAYIFSYYRFLLSERYEHALLDAGIEDMPIAYRKLRRADSQRGKCNIDFALEAVQEIDRRKSCRAIALDISDFFECLEHKRIYELWTRLLGVSRLDADHYRVFKAITEYSIVDKTELYERLGIIGFDPVAKRKRYLKREKDLDYQLCSVADFRSKVCGSSNSLSSIIQPKNRDRGVPQGAPLSDLLANLYLLDFDIAIAGFCREHDIYYRRYSDDLLFILPDSTELSGSLLDKVRDEIKIAGPQLKVKPSKTRVHKFDLEQHKRCCAISSEGGSFSFITKGPFEYLGFQYDGSQMRFRSSTLSGFYRKLKWAIKIEARRLYKRYPGVPTSRILNSISISEFYEKFGRINKFKRDSNVEDWNFWTYVCRCRNTLGAYGKPIARQLRGYKEFVRRHMEFELRALSET